MNWIDVAVDRWAVEIIVGCLVGILLIFWWVGRDF